MEKTNTKKTILTVLALLTLLSVCLMGIFMPSDTFAKYASESTSDGSTASIATPILVVSDLTDDEGLVFDLAEGCSYKFTVKNYKTVSGSTVYSETRMTFKIYVDVPSGSIVMPGDLYFSTKDDFSNASLVTDATKTTQENADGSTTYTYYKDDMTFIGSAYIRRYIIRLSASGAGTTQFTVRVEAVQVD